MSSNLRVNNILPSVGTNVAIGTAGGSITLTGTTSGTFSGNLTGNVNSTGVTTVTTLSATNIVGVSTLGVTTAYINTLSGISTINASSVVSINQNLVFASGKGIDFSATANSSGTMTSELLSDYEEGTWTPTLPSGGTVSSIYQATYTRIGRLVTIYFFINTSSIPNNSSQFQIGGLPYAAIGGSHFSTGQIGYSSNFNLGPWRPVVYTGGTYMYFHRIDGSSLTLLNSGATGLDQLLVSMWYYTT